MDNKTKNRIISALRKISRSWAPRKAAKDKCKVDKALFECSKCGCYIYEGKSAVNFNKLLEKYPKKKMRMERFDMDHIDPVVELTGWKDWNSFVSRLFCPEENWRGLCSSVCHANKTKAETKVRWANKYKDKK